MSPGPCRLGSLALGQPSPCAAGTHAGSHSLPETERDEEGLTLALEEEGEGGVKGKRPWPKEEDMCLFVREVKCRFMYVLECPGSILD